MSDIQYAVWVFDSTQREPQVIPMGNRERAYDRVDYYRRIDATRGTYGIAAKVVYRYRFMPDMPWEDA